MSVPVPPRVSDQRVRATGRRPELSALAALVRSDLVRAALFGFLLGRVALAGGLDPFPVAFVAAARQRGGETGLAATVGLAVGAATMFSAISVAALIPVYLAVLLGLGAVQTAPARLHKLLNWSLVAALSAAASLIVNDGGSGLPLAAVALPNALLGAVSFMAYRAAFASLAESSLAVPAKRRGANWLLVATALVGAFPISIEGIPLATVLVPLATLVAAQLAGLEMGAGLGVLLGVLALLAGTEPAAYALLAACAGTLAGWTRGYGRGVAALSYAAAAVALASFLPTPSTLVGALAGVTVALGLFLALPDRILSAIAAWAGLAPAPSQARAAHPLQQIAEVFEALSTTAAPQSPLAGERFGLGFERRLVEGVERRACRGCPLRTRCWDTSFPHTYAALTKGLAQLGTPDQQQALERDLATWCVRPRDVAIALGYVRDAYDLEVALANQWRQGQAMLSGQLQGLAQLLASLGGELDVAATAEGVIAQGDEARTLGWSVGLSRRPRQGVSGDHAIVRELPGQRLMVALSDGMGMGVKAAAESLPAVVLAERLLAAGFGQRVTAQTVNAMLLLGSRGESFATLDLAVVNLVTGEAEFTKIGAMPTFMRRHGKVERLVGASPPAGIVHRMEPDVRHRRLSISDWLLFMTDGAYEVLTSPDDAWLIGFLKELGSARGPQWVADALANRASEGAPAHVDDLTVLAIRLDAVTGKRTPPVRTHAPIGIPADPLASDSPSLGA